jgi:hypothetical protein
MNSPSRERPFPRVTTTADEVDVDFRSAISENVTQIVIRAVVDRDSDGSPQGIEILNLLDQIGSKALGRWARGDAPFAYDDEVDAFYVRLGSGRGTMQQSTDAVLFLDGDGLFRIRFSR